LLQGAQADWLKYLPIENNNMYLPLQEILCKHGVKSIQEATDTISKIFFRTPFGICTEETNKDIEDNKIGVIDGPWLGLIPETVDAVVKNTIKGMAKMTPNKELALS